MSWKNPSIKGENLNINIENEIKSLNIKFDDLSKKIEMIENNLINNVKSNDPINEKEKINVEYTFNSKIPQEVKLKNIPRNLVISLGEKENIQNNFSMQNSNLLFR